MLTIEGLIAVISLCLISVHYVHKGERIKELRLLRNAIGLNTTRIRQYEMNYRRYESNSFSVG